jgi:hypothetical protein
MNWQDILEWAILLFLLGGVGKSMKNEKNDSEREELIEQLSCQYSIYRDEIRLYAQLIFGSATLFGGILYWVMSSVRDPLRWAILPLIVVSFAGLFALMMVFMGIIASYVELLELKLNFLLGDHNDVFQYESYYIGMFESSYSGLRKRDRGFANFVLIWITTSLMPITLCGYALWKLWNSYPKSAWLLTIFSFVALWTIFLSARKIVDFRRKDNRRLLEEWKQRFVVPSWTANELPQE